MSVDIATGSPATPVLLLAGCQLVRLAGFGLGRQPRDELESICAGGCVADAVLRETVDNSGGRI